MRTIAKTSSTQILALAALGCLLFAGALFQLTGRTAPSEPPRIEMLGPIGAK